MNPPVVIPVPSGQVRAPDRRTSAFEASAVPLPLHRRAGRPRDYRADMQTRRLGRTGHNSSVAVLGAAAYWGSTPEEAGESFHAALEAGVNHLDVAPQYGRAQELLGPFIPAVRDRLFVGCKTLRHNADGVRAQLEESLQLLHCDTFDLYQLHAVTDLDAVMFPVNPRLWADADYRRDAEALLELATARDVGVMAIKAGAARPWGEREHTSTTWYEPYTALDDLELGVRFVLSTPGVHAFCTPGDTTVLPLALAAANAYRSMDDAERADAISRRSDERLIFPMRG